MVRPQSEPVVRPVNANGEPDMRGLGRLLWQKKSKILGFTIICAAAAFVVVNAMTPRYQSESRVLLEARQNVFLRADADKNIRSAPPSIRKRWRARCRCCSRAISRAK